MELDPKNPDFKARVESQLAKQNFMHLLGINLISILPGKTVAELVIQPSHFQHNGFVHGGVVATIADIVAGFAAYTLVGPDENVVTGEIKISYFAKGEGQQLRAIGSVIKPGGRVNFCEAEVYSINNGAEKLIAKATTSMITR